MMFHNQFKIGKFGVKNLVHNLFSILKGLTQSWCLAIFLLLNIYREGLADYCIESKSYKQE